PQSNQNKHRPISLTPTACKIMERILLNRLLHRIGKFDTGVNGFVKNRSAANCLANFAANDKAKTVVFLDIEKAFDRPSPSLYYTN
ncbi:reverse transcriptase domain-containing protein, partial [Escherichia coli]|uniref:reverse transcriptase domain-containing protein n=1 Tax=Escherichia coli TaxID=562 RepID=UPI003C6D5A57